MNVDLCEPADQIVDLEGPWPWPDSSVEEVNALDVIEHIGQCSHNSRWSCAICAVHGSGDEKLMRHPLGRIHFMNELHRVLLPGGRATIETPDAAKGAGFYQDPTHVSPWTRNSFQYFTAETFAHQRLAKAYGITASFRIVSLEERRYTDAFDIVWKITAVLEAVK